MQYKKLRKWQQKRLGKSKVDYPFTPNWLSSTQGGGEPFDPDSISNLLEDWNPALGVTIATGVSEWVGQKSGLILAQVTGANQPAFLATDVGGKPAIQFDGTNDYMERVGTISGLENRPGLTIYMVCNGGLMAYQSDNEITARSIQFNQSATAFRGRLADAGVDNNGVVTRSDSGYSIKEFVYSGLATGNANRLKLFVDGVQQTLTFTGTIPAATFSSGGTRSFYLGAVDTGSLSYTAGKFARILIYNKTLSDSERTQVLEGLTRDYLFFLNSFPYNFPISL